MSLSATLLEKPSLRTLQAWRDQLPLADTDTLARQLTGTLRALNERDLGPRMRFELLEGVAGPVRIVLKDASRRLAGQSFPVTSHARSVGERTARLIEAYTAGYRLVHEAPLSWWARLAGTNRQRLATERLLSLFDAYITQHRLVGMPLPEGTWCEVHQLYRHARSRRWHLHRLPGPAADLPKRKIDDTYARLLLTALLPVQQFTPPVWKEVQRNLPRWSKSLSLATVSRTTPGYGVDLSADSPPRPLRSVDSGRTGKDHLWIQTGRLAKLLRRRRGGAPLAPAILTLIYTSCCRPPARRHSRKEANRRGEAALGLSTLHHLLDPGAMAPAEPGKKIQSAPAAHLTITPLADGSKEMIIGGRDSSRVDVWDSIYGESRQKAREPKTDDWTAVDRSHVYRALPAAIDDISAAGLRLAFDLGLPLATRAGDLVGVKGRHGRWHAGVIRWLTEDGHTLRAGIELLAFECRALTLIGSAPDRPKVRLPALVGTTRNHRQVLALPALSSRHLENFTATIGSLTQPVAIKTTRLETPQFRLLEIEPLGEENTMVSP